LLPVTEVLQIKMNLAEMQSCFVGVRRYSYFV